MDVRMETCDLSENVSSRFPCFEYAFSLNDGSFLKLRKRAQAYVIVYIYLNLYVKYRYMNNQLFALRLFCWNWILIVFFLQKSPVTFKIITINYATNIFVKLTKKIRHINFTSLSTNLTYYATNIYSKHSFTSNQTKSFLHVNFKSNNLLLQLNFQSLFLYKYFLN